MCIAAQHKEAQTIDKVVQACVPACVKGYMLTSHESPPTVRKQDLVSLWSLLSLRLAIWHKLTKGHT